MPTTCIPSHIRLSLTPTSSLFFFTPPPTPEIYTLSLHDALPILILTMHENDEYVFQALRAGASGYMLKEAADTELISALHVVSNGNFYLSPSAQSVMVGDYLQRVHAGEEKDSYSSLTEREREILK